MRWISLAGLILLAVVGGCAGVPSSQVDSVSVYVLTAGPQRPSASARRDIVIEVAPPRAWPGFDSRQIVYARRPYELEHFAMSRWIDTPARMLAPLLVRSLEQTGSFRTVVQMPTSVPATYRLDTEIVRLLQDFSSQPSTAQIALRAQLTDLRTRRVVATRMFDDVERAPSENAAGGVAAGNVALHRLLVQIAEFCVEETSR